MWVLTCRKLILSTHTHTHHLPAVSVSIWDKQHDLDLLCLTYCPRQQTPALSSNSELCVCPCCRASSWKHTAVEAPRFPFKMLLSSWSCVAVASCPFTQSVSPICLPSFSLSLVPLPLCHVNLLPVLSLALTLSTCHRREIITPSPHSERAVKRPVGPIKPSRGKSKFRPTEHEYSRGDFLWRDVNPGCLVLTTKWGSLPAVSTTVYICYKY